MELKTIAESVIYEFDITLDELSDNKRKNSDARKVYYLLSKELTDSSPDEIANNINQPRQAVAVQIRRLKTMAHLMRTYKALFNELKLTIDD